MDVAADDESALGRLVERFVDDVPGTSVNMTISDDVIVTGSVGPGFAGSLGREAFMLRLDFVGNYLCHLFDGGVNDEYGWDLRDDSDAEEHAGEAATASTVLHATDRGRQWTPLPATQRSLCACSGLDLVQ